MSPVLVGIGLWLLLNFGIIAGVLVIYGVSEHRARRRERQASGSGIAEVNVRRVGPELPEGSRDSNAPSVARGAEARGGVHPAPP
jgi:hypothetical protein